MSAIQREQRTGIQIVAGTIEAVVTGIRIAGAEVHRVQRRVVAARHPQAAAAAQGDVVARPGISAGLSSRGIV